MKRKLLAYIGIAVGCAIALFQRFAVGEEYHARWYVWAPILAILGWSVWQLRERPDPNSKGFDFNPKRGAFFFVLGFLIFPLMLGIDALFGTDISMRDASMFTIGGSLFIGLTGVFTEHVGV